MTSEVFARAAGAEALGRLGRRAEAAVILAGEPDWADLRPGELGTLLTGCAWAAGEEAVQTAAAAGAAAVAALPGKEGRERQEALRAAAARLFLAREPGPDTPEAPWRVFRRASGPLGQAARLMDADRAEAEALLPEIGDWTDVPAGAVGRAVDLGLPLPPAFYRRSASDLREVIAALAGEADRDMLALALDWTAGQDFGETLTRFQFLFDLTAAALRTDRTWDNPAGAGALGEQLLSVAADLLPNLYSPALLADEGDWTALPGLHRFALYALRARAARDAGDQLGCVRDLQSALRAAPAMKKTVSAWLEEVRAAL